MSDGVLRMLGVLVALFQGDRQHGTGPSLVGIEEPETGLHPEAASMLVDALGEASERVQVMVSSHSADLLDEKAVQDDSILAAGFKQGRTNIGPLDAAMRSVIRDRISTAGELLRIGYGTRARIPSCRSPARTIRFAAETKAMARIVPISHEPEELEATGGFRWCWPISSTRRGSSPLPIPSPDSGGSTMTRCRLTTPSRFETRKDGSRSA